MDGENKQTTPKQHRRIGIISVILMLILVGVIVIVGMQFLTPNIPTYCPNMSLIDWCWMQGYTGPEQWKCTENWDHLPPGKLVLIIPKTMRKQIQIIGFAYSPSVYTRGELNEIQQQFLREQNLREYEAHIVKFDILMDVNGYPRFHILCDPQSSGVDSYSKGDNLFIDPDGLTVWHMAYEIENLQQDSHSIYIEFAHDDPGLENAHDDRCGFMCEYEAGSVSIELHKKLSFWDEIQAIWFFYPPFGSIVLFSLIGLIVFLVRKRVQRIRANNTPE